MEPRKVQDWLPHHKKKARNHILSCLLEKGYKVTDSDMSVMLKQRYKPFCFVWSVRCEVYGLNIEIADEKGFLDQITEADLLSQIEQPEAVVPINDPDISTDAQEAINSSVKKVTESLTNPDSSPTTKAKVKESEQKLFHHGNHHSKKYHKIL